MTTPFGYRPPSEPQLRLVRPNDVSTITNLDLKCYHYPMDLDEWKEFLQTINDTNKVVVLELGRRAVGFTAYELVEAIKEGDSYVQVTRLGVHPEYRDRGFGSMLVKNVETAARRMKADKVSFLVPEIHCCPGDPDDVTHFLNFNGYYASGVIEYNYKRMYGRVIDAFYFTKELV